MNVSRWRIAALTAVIAGISLAVLYYTFDASTLTALTRLKSLPSVSPAHREPGRMRSPRRRLR